MIYSWDFQRVQLATVIISRLFSQPQFFFTQYIYYKQLFSVATPEHKSSLLVLKFLLKVKIQIDSTVSKLVYLYIICQEIKYLIFIETVIEVNSSNYFSTHLPLSLKTRFMEAENSNMLYLFQPPNIKWYYECVSIT